MIATTLIKKINFKKVKVSNSFLPLAFLTEFKDVFKKLLVFTPGISKGYWNAKKIPFWALSSILRSFKLIPSK